MVNTNKVDTKFTEEQLGTAYIFLRDVKNNKILRDKWKKVLSETKSNKIAVDEKIKFIDNFLSENGYDTEAQAVLHVIKSDWWAQYLKDSISNSASDKFVQRILKDPVLYSKWLKVLSKAFEDKDLKKANQMLKDLGYSCTTEQVNSSFNKMRNKNVKFWVGVYGKSYKKIIQSADPSKKQDDKPKNLPLIVYGDGSISVGPDHIFGSTYKNGTLTWPLQPKDTEKYPFPNPHSGKITFSQLTTPKDSKGYVGPIFSGKISYESAIAGKSDVYDYEGQIGEPDRITDGKFHIPADMHNKHKYSELEKISRQVNVVVPFIFVAGALLAIGKFGYQGFGYFKKKFGNRGGGEQEVNREEVLENNMEENQQIQDNPVADEDLVENIYDSPELRSVENLYQELNNTVNPEQRAQIENQIQEQQAQIEQQQEEANENEEAEYEEVNPEGEIATDFEAVL